MALNMSYVRYLLNLQNNNVSQQFHPSLNLLSDFNEQQGTIQ